MQMRELKTIDEVLKELGGLTAAGRLVGLTAQHINNYKAAGRFAPKTYVAFTEELRNRGFTAPRSLWGMLEPVNEPERAA